MCWTYMYMRVYTYVYVSIYVCMFAFTRARMRIVHDLKTQGLLGSRRRRVRTRRLLKDLLLPAARPTQTLEPAVISCNSKFPKTRKYVLSLISERDMRQPAVTKKGPSASLLPPHTAKCIIIQKYAMSCGLVSGLHLSIADCFLALHRIVAFHCLLCGFTW